MKKKVAFSLTELSIVILVVGIIIVGVNQASDMISQFRIKTVASLTNSSSVNSISGLVLWYETTMEKSITFNAKGNVIKWNDVNPQSTSKINAVPYTGSNPVAEFTNYNSDGVNGVGIPSMYFNGSSNHGFNVPNIPIIGGNATIFLVEQHNNGVLDGQNNGIFCQLGDGAEFCIMYHNSGWNGLRYIWRTNQSYSTSIGLNAGPKILSHCLIFKYGVNGGMEYYLNGVQSFITGPTNNSALAANYNNIKIGYKSRGQFTGHVFEIIVFNKKLTTLERKAVDGYLTQKYGLK